MPPASIQQLAAFGFFAAVAVVSALATVMMRNPIRNAVGLFVHVLSLAGLYIRLSAHFLTAVQLIVYVGAVVVLFVFVIMLLGPASEAPSDTAGRLPRGIGAAAMIAAGVFLARVVIDLRPSFEKSVRLDVNLISLGLQPGASWRDELDGTVCTLDGVPISDAKPARILVPV